MPKYDLPKSYAEAKAELDKNANGMAKCTLPIGEGRLSMEANCNNMRVARAPERQSARAPERQSARAPERQSARAPERQSARAPEPSCISILHEDLPFVKFFASGQIKLFTHGTNDRGAIVRLNACLPSPYSVRRRVNTPHIDLIDCRRPADPVATFLSSTTFTPDPLAPETKGAA
jgi:hypothetical protein